MAVVALAFLGGRAWALTPVVRCIDSTVVSLTLEIDSTASAANLNADSVTKIILYYGTATNPTTVAGTITTGATCPDTVTVTGLHNGTTYYFAASVWATDTTTATRTIVPTIKPAHTAQITAVTKTIGQTIAVITDSSAVDGTFRNFRVSDVWFSDSTLVTLAMQYRLTDAANWTWAAVAAHYGNAVGRDSVQLASPDTICALSNDAAIDLLPGRTYDVRVIGYYGTAAAQAFRGSDTSNTLTVSTATVPGYSLSYNLPTGEVSPGVWHFSDSWATLSHTWYSPHFNVNGYKKLIIESQKFGMDNNHPADSSKTYLMMVNHSNDVGYSKLDSTLFNGLSGGLATAATGVMALPDTASGRKTYTLSVGEVRTVARAGNDTTFINAYNPELYFYTAVKDSALDFGASVDTTTIDRIYEDIWIYGIK